MHWAGKYVLLYVFILYVFLFNNDVKVVYHFNANNKQQRHEKKIFYFSMRAMPGTIKCKLFYCNSTSFIENSKGWILFQ